MEDEDGHGYAALEHEQELELELELLQVQWMVMERVMGTSVQNLYVMDFLCGSSSVQVKP